MRAESLVRAGENTDASTSSTSISSSLDDRDVAVDDAVAHGVDHGGGAVGEHRLALASRWRRASCSCEPSPCRTVTTKSSPTNMLISPVSTASSLVDVPERLER